MLTDRVGDDLCVAQLQEWADGLEELSALIGRRFARSEPREHAMAYIRGLLSAEERKNSWTLSEQAGDATPNGMQRLLSTTDWDPDLVRDDLQRYVVAHLGDPGGVLIIDETGFLKKGTRSAGVARQYSGTAGRIENCQIGVFLTYATAAGRTFLDRELYLPKAWTEDRVRCAAAGIGADVEFATKPELAMSMLQRAHDNGVPARWVTADEVYGQHSRLRAKCEELGLSYVLAVGVNQHVIAGPGRFAGQEFRADALVAALPVQSWRTISAGKGAKGDRLYDWARVRVHGVNFPTRCTGCWPAAACPTRPIWRTTCATPRPARLSRNWSPSPEPVGPSRKRSKPRKAKPGWITTRSGNTPAGIDTPRCPCWPMPS